jgi:hypothetical protein
MHNAHPLFRFCCNLLVHLLVLKSCTTSTHHHCMHCTYSSIIGGRCRAGGWGYGRTSGERREGRAQGSCEKLPSNMGYAVWLCGVSVASAAEEELGTWGERGKTQGGARGSLGEASWLTTHSMLHLSQCVRHPQTECVQLCFLQCTKSSIQRMLVSVAPPFHACQRQVVQWLCQSSQWGSIPHVATPQSCIHVQVML